MPEYHQTWTDKYDVQHPVDFWITGYDALMPYSRTTFINNLVPDDEEFFLGTNEQENTTTNSNNIKDVLAEQRQNTIDLTTEAVENYDGTPENTAEQAVNETTEVIDDIVEVS
jgi:hypothetical protein